MSRRVCFVVLVITCAIFLFPPFVSKSAFADRAAAEYLNELGVSFYNTGKYDDALDEFQKALLVDPGNKTAKSYVNKIFEETLPVVPKAKTKQAKGKVVKKIPPEKETEVVNQLGREEAIDDALNRYWGKSEEQPLQPAKKSEKQVTQKIQQLFPEREKPKSSRDQIIDQELNKYWGKPEPKPIEKKEVKKAAEEKPPAVLSGEYRIALGVTPDEVIWKDANADKQGVPREKNWRYLWGEQHENTYDPKIYDRLEARMQTQSKGPLNAFLQLDIDPWTFIGRNNVTVTSSNSSDTADIKLKYWSADGRTINETYRTDKGNILNLPQIKVLDGKTTLTTPTGITSWGTRYNQIGQMKVDRDYRPFRKFWAEYKQDSLYLKVFPLSDQEDALYSDDPLRLSNNHVYWEESPWLDAYEPSRTFDKAGNPVKTGRWIRSLSFFTRDSSDDYPHRLTYLRGATFKADPGPFSFETSVATPLALWDEYYRSNSIDQAARLKVPIGDDFQIGFTQTGKLGLNGGSTEAQNYTGALDLKYAFSDDANIYAQGAGSYTNVEEAKGFNTVYSGPAGKLGFSYNAPKEKKGGIYKTEFYLANMTKDFLPGLSNYRYTRGDTTAFSRHITFTDIKPEDKELIWGDGIDKGRNVIGLEFGLKGFNENLDFGLQVRNVHDISGKQIENVARTETTIKPVSKLTTKILTYYQQMPKTQAGIDPLLYDKTMYSLSDYFSNDDEHPENTNVRGGEDPSVGAFGFGARYDFTEKLALEGAYERTNDPLDFPRSLFNDVYVTTQSNSGQLYDRVVPFLYDQQFFMTPPYNYYDIDKARLIYKPVDELEFILSYTYNENKFTTGLDSNINHAGLEATYRPSKRLTLWSKYIYSRLIDTYKMSQYRSDDFFDKHSNFFFAGEYQVDKDSTFSLLYGEFVGYDDPYQQANWSLSTVDTQHIFRFFYKRKF